MFKIPATLFGDLIYPQTVAVLPKVEANYLPGLPFCSSNSDYKMCIISDNLVTKQMNRIIDHMMLKKIDLLGNVAFNRRIRDCLVTGW